VVREALERLVEIEGRRTRIDLEAKGDSRALWRGVDAQADRRVERIRVRVEELDGLARPQRALDVDRRRLAEVDLEGILARQRGLDHLLLDFAVERDRELLEAVVLADVDQRVLLRELGEREFEPALVLGTVGNDDGLQRRRGEMMLRAPSTRIVPENIRTYAIFSPAAPRSTLKTVPETGPSASPAADGNSSAMPVMTESTPAPVNAEPKKTGCKSALAVCSMRASRARTGESFPST
jgi:hypothetical protein